MTVQEQGVRQALAIAILALHEIKEFAGSKDKYTQPLVAGFAYEKARAAIAKIAATQQSL